MKCIIRPSAISNKNIQNARNDQYAFGLYVLKMQTAPPPSRTAGMPIACYGGREKYFYERVWHEYGMWLFLIRHLFYWRAVHVPVHTFNM